MMMLQTNLAKEIHGEHAIGGLMRFGITGAREVEIPSIGRVCKMMLGGTFLAPLKDDIFGEQFNFISGTAILLPSAIVPKNTGYAKQCNGYRLDQVVCSLGDIPASDWQEFQEFKRKQKKK